MKTDPVQDINLSQAWPASLSLYAKLATCKTKKERSRIDRRKRISNEKRAQLSSLARKDVHGIGYS